MQYDDLVIDFARRTRVNLDFVKLARSRGDTVHEVTQLVNSALGLLVFPQQRHYDLIPATPLKDLQAAGWPIPAVVRGYQQVGDLRALLRYMRNAVSHCNLEFRADADNEVVSLQLWNEDRNGVTTWRAELGVDQLDLFAARLSEVLEHLPAFQIASHPTLGPTGPAPRSHSGSRLLFSRKPLTLGQIAVLWLASLIMIGASLSAVYLLLRTETIPSGDTIREFTDHLLRAEQEVRAARLAGEDRVCVAVVWDAGCQTPAAADADLQEQRREIQTMRAQRVARNAGLPALLTIAMVVLAFVLWRSSYGASNPVP